MARKAVFYLLLFFMVGSFGCAPADSPEVVRPARPDWNTGWFQTEIFRQLIEELDYPVEEAHTMTDAVFFPAVAEGEVDFWADGWFPNASEDLKKVQDRVEALGYVIRAGALQGYMIDRKTAETHSIWSLADLQRPEIARLFDVNGDGMADLTGCSPEWTCADWIDHHLKVFGLESTVAQVQGDYDQLFAETLSRFRQGEPIFFYTWTPNWTVGELAPGRDVIWLEVPFAAVPQGLEAELERSAVSGVSGCASDPCLLGYPPNDIRVVANRTFLNRNVSIRRLFELVEVPIADISRQNALMHSGEDSDEDLRRHAREWIQQNRSRIEQWLSAARQTDDRQN